MQSKLDRSHFEAIATGRVSFESNPGFLRFFEIIDEAVFVIAAHTTAIQYVNHRAVELTGYGRNDLRNVMLKDIIWIDEKPGERLGHVEPGLVRKFKRAVVNRFNKQQTTVDLKVTRDDGQSGFIFVTASEVMAERPKPKAFASETQAISILERLSSLIANPIEGSRSEALRLCKDFLKADVAGWYLTGSDRHGATCEEFDDLPDSFPKWIELHEIQNLEQTQLWHKVRPPKTHLERCALNGDLAAMYGHPTKKNGRYTGLLVVGYRNASKIPSQAESRLMTLVRYLSAFDDIYTQVQRGQIGSDVSTQNVTYVKKLMDGMTAGVIEIDNRLSVISMNNAAEKMLGFSSRNIYNVAITDVLVANDALLQGMLEQIQAGIIVDTEEEDIDFTRRDGQPIPARLKAVPLTDAQDKHAGALIFLYDQSEIKRMEDQQMHLSKRAHLGDTISEFAHDVRQPLNTIQMAIQLLEVETDPNNEDALETIAQAQQEINRLNTYVNETLRVVKYKSEMQPTKTDLRAFMEKQAKLWTKRLAQSEIRVETNLVENVPLVKVDPHQLEHAVSNLIGNAIKAMKQNPNPKQAPRLMLGVRSVVEQRLSDVHLVRVDVGDTGPGITREQQSKIFQRYVSDNKNGSGAGLGLAMVRKIVESHGGDIGVSSAAGFGSVFSIQFPAHIETPEISSTDQTESADAAADPAAAVSPPFPVIIGETSQPNSGLTH